MAPAICIAVGCTDVTTSSANADGLCEHTVSWNGVKCCTNVQRIAFEKACNRWMTFQVTAVAANW